MTLDDLDGRVGTEHVLTYADGVVRRVFVVEHEVPFPDGRLIVSRTDPSGIITHANESFVAMSGYTLDELLGQPHYILRHPHMPAAAFADLWATVTSGRKWSGYVQNLRKDGASYWVYASVVPNIRTGVITGYTSVRRKPSRRRVVEAAARYASMR
jgi:PAS domain S-box-containing protein